VFTDQAAEGSGSGRERVPKCGDSPTRLGRHRALVPRSIDKPGEGRKIIGTSATDRDADPSAHRLTVLVMQRRRPRQSHLGKVIAAADGPASKFPNSASALRLAVLFGLERAALALGHHANLDTSYGLFLLSGFSISRGSGWLSSWSETSGPAVLLIAGPPRQIVVRLEQYPCSTTSRISRPRKRSPQQILRLDATAGAA
jgi:hypothetical protein